MLATLVAAAGISFDITGASLLGISPNDMRLMVWVAVIVFIVLTFWREVDLSLRAHPKIKVKPFVDLSKCAKLEILNNGARAEFTATFRIIKDRHNDSSNLFEMVWETPKTINYKGSGAISVARKVHIREPEWPIMTPAIKLFYNVINTGSVESLTTGYWDEHDDMIDQTKPPSNIYIEISITAEPPLRKSFTNMMFELSQSTIHDLNFTYCNRQIDNIRKLKLGKEGYLS